MREITADRGYFKLLSLEEERYLIAKAKQGCKAEADELVLRYVGFINFRLRKKVFPAYIARFGEDILSQAVFILYDKIKTYDLRYRDKNGDLKPVKFSSYIWKRIDGFILDSLKKELSRERREVSLERGGNMVTCCHLIIFLLGVLMIKPC
jgi:DNA-directed RNA polymerase specialized sigma subunit